MQLKTLLDLCFCKWNLEVVAKKYGKMSCKSPLEKKIRFKDIEIDIKWKGKKLLSFYFFYNARSEWTEDGAEK